MVVAPSFSAQRADEDLFASFLRHSSSSVGTTPAAAVPGKSRLAPSLTGGGAMLRQPSGAAAGRAAASSTAAGVPLLARRLGASVYRRLLPPPPHASL